MVRHLDSLINMRQQERNRYTAGITCMYILAMMEEHIGLIEEQITELKKQIAKLIEQHEELKRQKDLLVSIPGIGELTAAKLISEIVDVRRFESASQLSAYAGITPQQHSSGTSIRGRGRMSKTGNVHLRKSLYMPALVAKKNNPIVHAFCEQLANRGKQKMVIVGAAMHKLLMLVYGVLKSGKAFDPNYARNMLIAS